MQKFQYYIGQLLPKLTTQLDEGLIKHFFVVAKLCLILSISRYQDTHPAQSAIIPEEYYGNNLVTLLSHFSLNLKTKSLHCYTPVIRRRKKPPIIKTFQKELHYRYLIWHRLS